MNRDDIIRMAREAGFDKNSLGWTFTHGKLGESIERFAALVAAAEREACAEMCEVKFDFCGDELLVADAIRARGKE